jgi:hypothetical protein
MSASLFTESTMGKSVNAAPLWCLAQVVIVALTGCGESKPTLDESSDYFVEAQTAIAAGDTAKALELLGLSIETKPYSFAYFQRARIYVDQGKDAEALADAEAGLAIEPENLDLKWLRDELKKPKPKRFQGKFKNPPRAVK